MPAIDLEAKQVSFEEMEPLGYDYLVLALGAEVNFFGTPGAAEHAFPMYTLSDAVRLRGHVLERWEAADRDPSLIDDGALNVVIVGGGPTGVETAGALAELYRNSFAKDYRSIPQEKARLILVEAGPTLFSMFHEDLQAYARALAEAHRRGDDRRGRAVGRADPRDAEVGRGAHGAHARLGRRPRRRARSPTRSESSSSAAIESRSGRT